MAPGEYRALLRASDDPLIALGNRPWVIDVGPAGLSRVLDWPLTGEIFQLAHDRKRDRHYLLRMESLYVLQPPAPPTMQPAIESLPRPIGVLPGAVGGPPPGEQLFWNSITFDSVRDRLVVVTSWSLLGFEPDTLKWETIRPNRDLDPRWPWGVDRLVHRAADDRLHGFDQGRRMLVTFDSEAKVERMVDLDPDLVSRQSLGSPFDRRVQLFDGGEHLIVLAMRQKSPTMSPTHALRALPLDRATGRPVREKRLWPGPVAPR